jgi:formylglycine-generating enzyme required for sulfatase activity
MGTPEYSAPEQATDARKADIRADLYSLGCTLYCLLAGQPPFREETAVLTILAHLEKAPSPLPELRPDVPAGLWAVVARLLAKEPARRYQTPAEVALALVPFCRPGQKAGAVPGTVAAGGPGEIAAEAATLPPCQPNAPAGLPEDQRAAAPPQGDLWAGLGAGVERKRRSLRWGVQVGILGCLGLLVLVGLGVGGLVALSLRRSGADSGRPLLTQPAAVADTAPGVGVPRPALLDCTGAAGVSAAAVKEAQVAWAQYLGRPVEETVEVADGVKVTFVLVPPGKFLMGSPADEKDRSDDEMLHAVTLTEPFDLGKTEVTQAQYQALTGANPSKFKGAELPVERVSWEEARDYAAKLMKKQSVKHLYRLPTEAEWEYACRGGRSSSNPFDVGDGRALSSREANFDGNLPYGGADKGPNLQATCRVGSYPANALGLSDMHGNVDEWCADWYGPYPQGAVTNPSGPPEGSSRVDRGGCWSSPARRCRAGYRGRIVPGLRHATLGFRVARSSPSDGK